MNKKSKKITLILLIISLCFNVFFAAGFIYSRHILKKIRTPEGRMQIVSKRLDLTQYQQESFLLLREQLQTHALKTKQEFKSEIDSFWQELVKNNPDTLKIKKLIEEASQGRTELMILASKQIQEFLKTLTPEQREAYVKFLRRNKIGN